MTVKPRAPTKAGTKRRPRRPKRPRKPTKKTPKKAPEKKNTGSKPPTELIEPKW